MSQTQAQALSFNPNDAVQGGLLDAADVIVRAARICMWDYNGKAKATTAIRVQFEDGDGKLHEQYYSIGDPERYVPSEDGTQVLPTNGATGLNTSSNGYQFMKSLVDSGVPADFVTTDISKIDGIKLHVQQVAQPKRAGLSDQKDRTILLATKLIALPGQSPVKGGSKGSANATAPAAAAASVSGDVADKAIIYISQVLAANGGTVPRAKVSQLVFQAANTAKDSDKAALTKIVYDEKFLAENSGRPVENGTDVVAFEYDAASKTLKAAA